MENPEGWMYSWQLIDWAKANLNIPKPNEDLTDHEIRRVVRWIGDSSVDTVYINGEITRPGRIGINNMLLVTMLEFPDYYMKYELAQFN
jgi:hypothetical protein